MGTQWISTRDVLDQCHFFQDIPGYIPLAGSPVDDGQCQTVTMPEQEHDRHGEELVYFAGDTGKLCTRVLVTAHMDGEEQVRLEDVVIHLPAAEGQAALRGLG